MKTKLSILLGAALSLSACNGGKTSDADSLLTAQDAMEAEMPDISNTYGIWRLLEVDGQIVDFEAMMTFNKDKKLFSAKICNSMGGKFIQKERRPDAIRIEDVCCTQMMGPEEEMKIEDAFSAVLPNVRTFCTKADTLILMDENENVLITAVKVAEEEEE